MLNIFKNREKSGSFDPEEIRKKNNKAVQELIKMNEKLQNTKDLQIQKRDWKTLKKAEMKLNKACEKQREKLHLELDIWEAEEKKRINLERKAFEQIETSKRMKQEVIQKEMLESQCTASRMEQERLIKLNTTLLKNLKTLKDKLSYQNGLYHHHRQTKNSIETLMKIKENVVKEMKNNYCWAWKEKISEKDKTLEKVKRKTIELLQELNSIEQQLIDMPVLKYIYKSAKQEKERLKKLNTKLEKHLQTLKDNLSHQTELLCDYTEAEIIVKELQEIRQHYLGEIQDLKVKEKLEPGSKSKFTNHEDEKKKSQ
ncbi:intersectin-2-like [Gambusia affinis]|uniref:intersectin-2-like n=1 Tax=Gambusia affinis TaxID=33528 RepID=UPI001CDC6DF6|nr:intersectin-2-like [Gambusia affinis]